MRCFALLSGDQRTNDRNASLDRVGLMSGGPPLGDELPPSRGAWCEYLCLSGAWGNQEEFDFCI